MKRDHDVIVLVIFTLFAGVMTFQSWQLGLGTFSEPGPGFLPIVSTITIGVLSLVGLYVKVRKAEKIKGIEFKRGENWKKSVYLMLLSFLYITVLWDWLGFIISSTLWLAFVFRIGGLKSWAKNLALSIVIVVVSYFLFGKAGGTLLPVGIFGF